MTCYLRHGEHGVFARAEKLVVLGDHQLGAGGEPPAWCWRPRWDLGPEDWGSGVRRVFIDYTLSESL